MSSEVMKEQRTRHKRTNLLRRMLAVTEGSWKTVPDR